jgi:tetratricopeptide (TPR) repeat protein
MRMSAALVVAAALIGGGGCRPDDGGVENMAELPVIDSLWNYAEPQQSEARFRDLLSRARESGQTEYVAELLTQIGRAQGLQQNFDGAHESLDEAETLLAGDMSTGRVRLFLERGRVLNSSGRPEESVPFFQEAFDTAESADLPFYAVDAAHMLGIVRPGQESIRWNERAIALAAASSDPAARGWLGSLYNNMGWTHHDLGRYQEAFGWFERDYELRNELDRPVEAGISRWSMANALRHMGRVEEALEIQQELLDAPGRQNNDAEGYTREEIGEALLVLGRADEATPHFARAWELLKDDPWLSRDEPERLGRLRKLGGLTE